MSIIENLLARVTSLEATVSELQKSNSLLVQQQEAARLPPPPQVTGAPGDARQVFNPKRLDQAHLAA